MVINDLCSKTRVNQSINICKIKNYLCFHVMVKVGQNIYAVVPANVSMIFFSLHAYWYNGVSQPQTHCYGFC